MKKDFHVPQEVYDHFRNSIVEKGEQKEKEWNDLFSNYKKEFPELGTELEQAIKHELPARLEKGYSCL